MSSSCLSASGDEVLVAVRVTPRSPRLQLDAPRDGRLIVRVNAPPADGAANEQVIKLMAKRFGLSRSSLRIVRGGTSRDKLIALRGVSLSSAEQVVEALSK